MLQATTQAFSVQLDQFQQLLILFHVFQEKSHESLTWTFESQLEWLESGPVVVATCKSTKTSKTSPLEIQVLCLLPFTSWQQNYVIAISCDQWWPCGVLLPSRCIWQLLVFDAWAVQSWWACKFEQSERNTFLVQHLLAPLSELSCPLWSICISLSTLSSIEICSWDFETSGLRVAWSFRSNVWQVAENSPHTSPNYFHGWHYRHQNHSDDDIALAETQTQTLQFPPMLCVASHLDLWLHRLPTRYFVWGGGECKHPHPRAFLPTVFWVLK